MIAPPEGQGRYVACRYCLNTYNRKGLASHLRGCPMKPVAEGGGGGGAHASVVMSQGHTYSYSGTQAACCVLLGPMACCLIALYLVVIAQGTNRLARFLLYEPLAEQLQSLYDGIGAGVAR